MSTKLKPYPDFESMTVAKRVVVVSEHQDYLRQVYRSTPDNELARRIEARFDKLNEQVLINLKDCK